MNENGRRSPGLGEDTVDAGEMRAARQLSEQIDRMLAGQPVDSNDPELVIAKRLSRLADLLPSVEATFEERILASPQRSEHRWPGLRFPIRPLSLAAAAVLVVLMLVLTVPGQTALARLAALFQLDSVQVGINVATATPADARRAVATRIERPLGGLAEAQQVAPVPILVPTDLPASWSLQAVTAVSYPDLPANAPLNVVLTYKSTSGASLEMIEYFVQLGDNLTIDSLNRVDETSTSVGEATIDGQRVVVIESAELKDMRTLIWQQAGVLLEVEAHNVTMEDLLSITASVQPID